MRILYIGNTSTYACYKKGLNPSHWLYGAVEMEKDGHEVVWEEERSKWDNDWKLLRKYRPDRVFIPNLNLHAHIVLLLLKAVGLCRIPVYAYLHHEPKVKEGWKRWIYAMLLSGCNHLFFLSEQTRRHTVEAGLVTTDRSSVPGWGADESFFAGIAVRDGGYFVSTGKENRDFDILIDAFRRTGAPLKIITSRGHAGTDYADLPTQCAAVKNIEVVLTENSGEVYPLMLKAMAEAKALVCPLRKDKLNYCVGLSTITDAEGLGKPLIITRNPYHESKRMKPFCQVDTVEDWCEASRKLQEDSSPTTPRLAYSMQRAYARMKEKMSLNE